MISQTRSKHAAHAATDPSGVGATTDRKSEQQCGATALGRLNQTAQTMTPVERQKLLRMLVKQITVGKDLITIHHSIPTGATRGSAELTSYPLCTRGHLAGAGQHLSALRAGPVVGAGGGFPSNEGAAG